MVTLWRQIERVVLILGAFGAIFAAGMNWHRIDGHDAALAALSRQEDQIKAEFDKYERVDLLKAELRRIDEKLDQIQAQLKDKDERVPRFR